MKEFEEQKKRDTLAEERLDREYAPKSMNSRKTIAPILIYKILVDITSDEHHISQKELGAILLKKYELNMDRRTLMRQIHTLCDEGLGICCSTKGGVWYDSDLEWKLYA